MKKGVCFKLEEKQNKTKILTNKEFDFDHFTK